MQCIDKELFSKNLKNNAWKWVIVLLLILGFTGCSAMGLKRSINSDDLATIKKIGVYSGFGDQINVDATGITIISNDFNSENVPTWDIKGFSEKSLVSILKENKSLQSVGIIQGLSGTEPDLESIIISANKQGYDTAILAVPSGYDNARFLRPGYGLAKRNLLVTSLNGVYALFVLKVYDTKTKEELAWQWGFDAFGKGPLTDIDLDWKDKFSEYSSTETKILERLIKAKIQKGIRYGIEELEILSQ